jgi:hypothetical protein
VKDQPAARGGGVDRLGEAAEPNAPFLQGGDGLDEVRQTAAEPGSSRCLRVQCAADRAIVRQIEAAGVTTHRAIAAALNARGIRTVRGGAWHGGTVRNLLAGSNTARP